MRNSLGKKANPSKKRYRLIVLFFILLIGGITLFSLIRGSRWDGKRRFTLVLHQFENLREPQKGVKLSIFSLEPRHNRASYVFLPENTMLDVPFGYKIYRASSVYQLGELDPERGGGKLLAKSIENTFSVVVNGYLIGEKNALPFLTDKREEMKDIKKTYFTIPGILSFFSFSAVKSNLSFLDLLRLFWAIRSLRDDQISFLNLGIGNILTDTSLPDKTKVQEVNKDILDVVIGNAWEDGQIRAEQVSLRVVNATSQEGIASSFSRILEHMGANVVEKTTAKKEEKEKCTIFVFQKKERTKSIIKRLREEYNCQIKEEKSEGGSADITIVIGEDYLK